MISIERTAYPRFRCALTVWELREIYTPTLTDVAFVATTARGPTQKFGLMILLKVYRRLGYFPKPETIPGAIIGHIRAAMKFATSLVPDITSNHTLYRYHAAIRTHLEIQSEGKHIWHIAAQAMHKAAQVMEIPADLINAATEMLVKEHSELPAFSTLERVARRIRTLVNRASITPSSRNFPRRSNADSESCSNRRKMCPGPFSTGSRRLRRVQP